jgi:hypothetical protein
MLAVDNGRLYWTRTGNNFTKGGLFSAKLDGTDLKPHYELALTESCTGLGLAKGKAFFVCVGGTDREMRTCDLPDCNTTKQVKDALTTNASAVAADSDSGRAFYAVRTPYNTTTGGRVYESDGTAVGDSDQPSPVALVVHAGYLYWLNAGTYTSDVPNKNGGVRRAALTDLGTEQVVLGANTNYYDNAWMAVDSVNAYYVGRNKITSKTDVVYGPSNGSGSLSVFAGDQDSNVVAADDTNVYFDNGTAPGSILFCVRSKGCGLAPKTLADGEGDVYAMTTDAVSVIWVRSSGEIRRVAKP